MGKWLCNSVSFAQSSPNGGRISGFVTQKTITINTSKTNTGTGMDKT